MKNQSIKKVHIEMPSEMYDMLLLLKERRFCASISELLRDIIRTALAEEEIIPSR